LISHAPVIVRFAVKIQKSPVGVWSHAT
jgi:hypothetical protein